VIKRKIIFTIGKNLDVLFESESEDARIKGFSSNYVRFQHKYDKNFRNQVCSIIVKGIRDGLAYGEIKEIKNSVALEISSI
jgi:hypothetical protein